MSEIAGFKIGERPKYVKQEPYVVTMEFGCLASHMCRKVVRVIIDWL